VAKATGMRRDTAQKLLYTLRLGGALSLAGKTGNALLYTRAQADAPTITAATRQARL
jgi:hypothetical protein